MEESDMWRLSSGSANWRFSGSDSIAMESEVSRMSGGLFRLALTGGSNSFRSLVDSPAPDGVLSDDSPSAKAHDDNPGASSSMHADEANLSTLPPPPVPVRGVARMHPALPISPEDINSLSAVLAEVKETPARPTQHSENFGTATEPKSKAALDAGEAEAEIRDSDSLSGIHVSTTSIGSLELDLDTIFQYDSVDQRNTPLSNEERKRVRPLSLEQLHNAAAEVHAATQMHRTDASGGLPIPVPLSHPYARPVASAINPWNRVPMATNMATPGMYGHTQPYLAGVPLASSSPISVPLPTTTAKRRKPPRHWRRSEDARLQEAVKTFGTDDWNTVAKHVVTRTRAQCLYHWKNALNPELKKGQWEAAEDAQLRELHAKHGTNWKLIATHIEGRNQKQCRERWCHHLDPTLKKGNWTEAEDRFILESQARLGNKWSQISKLMHGRTDNHVKIRYFALVRMHQRNLPNAARPSRKKKTPTE